MKQMEHLFTERMMAPCGLDCSLCSQVHKKTNPCSGCTGPDENKPEFCSTRCDIIRCPKRKKHNFRFCDECPDFPCKHSLERESRYMSQYALKESPLTNLRDIREKGMETFLREERYRWTCKKCGGVFSVHDGVCSGCGTDEMLDKHFGVWNDDRSAEEIINDLKASRQSRKQPLNFD